MVDGRILYEDGKFDIGFDPKEIYAKANGIIRRMWEKRLNLLIPEIVCPEDGRSVFEKSFPQSVRPALYPEGHDTDNLFLI